jgi:HAD superfamily hydrolase (TIGR01509 family)
MKFPDLVIFDCDGVLVDSELLACGAVAEVLEAVGIAFTPEEIVARYTGVSAVTMFRDIELYTGRTLPADFASRVQERVLAVFRRDLKAMPGIESVLDTLPCCVCVASSSTPERIRLALTVTGLIDHFDGNQFSATQVLKGKPAPDLFLFAAEQMSAAPGDCVVVEDSPPGVRAALDAGMGVVGFVGGSHYNSIAADRLSSIGAQTIATHAIDLPDSIREAWHRLKELRNATGRPASR